MMSSWSSYRLGTAEGFGSGPISSCLTNAGFMNEHIDTHGDLAFQQVSLGRATRSGPQTYRTSPQAPLPHVGGPPVPGLHRGQEEPLEYKSPDDATVS